MHKTSDFDSKLAVRTLSKADQRLAGLIGKVGPFSLRVDRTQSPFHALLKSIMYQQLSGKAAADLRPRE